MASIEAEDREKEWAVLIECASAQPSAAHLSELLQAPVDWPALLVRAEEHGVLGLFVERLKDLHPAAPAELRETLRQWERRQTVLALSLIAEMFRVLERFESLGIEALVTKGPALSVRCYGEPGRRQYSDLDLIVRDKDIQGSTEAMIALGYAPTVPLGAIQAAKFPGEYAFHKPGTQLLVELHTERTFRYHPRRLPIERLFERRVYVTIDSREIAALSIEDELVLICVHGAKHFWERLMWIADVGALLSKKDDVDWERATAAAREVGAERILRLGLRLAMDVVKAAVPEHVAAQVRADSTAVRLATQITKRLAASDPRRMGLVERAAFRVKMRPSLLHGATYLMRLSLSPTEEDWVPGAETERSWLLEALGRPIRLARKHGRNSGA
jgi:putative nucleotidyltransferase-like protein